MGNPMVRMFLLSINGRPNHGDTIYTYTIIKFVLRDLMVNDFRVKVLRYIDHASYIALRSKLQGFVNI